MRNKINISTFNSEKIGVPKELIFNLNKYSQLSAEGILLYSILYDSLKISLKNKWITKEGDIYLKVRKDILAKILRLKTIEALDKTLAELKTLGLIEEKNMVGPIIEIYVLQISFTEDKLYINSFLFKDTAAASTKQEIDQEVLDTYKSCISSIVSKVELKTLSYLQSISSTEIILRAMDMAIEHNGKNLGYIKKVILDWNSKGLKTIDQVNEHLSKWNNKNQLIQNNRENQTLNNGKNKVSGTKTNFNNYEQREYDYDELEKKLLGWDNRN